MTRFKIYLMIKLNIAKRMLKKSKSKLVLYVFLITLGLFTLKFGLPTFWEQTATSCHYDKVNSSLEVLGNGSRLPSKSIFFHHTSCDRNLTSRQSCAIESASRVHPDWQINVVFSGAISDSVQGYPHLKMIKNVKFWRVYIEDIAKGTPFEKVVQSGVLKKCRFSEERTLDVLKYLTLYKWGGIFLDLDMIVGMAFGSLGRNWVARENDVTIADKVFAFSRDRVGRFMAQAAVRDILMHFENSDWCNNPGTMGRVLERVCLTKEPTYMSAATCYGFEVYGQQFFYPLPKERAQEYFTARELGVYNSYTYYMWAEVTKNAKITIGSPYFKLARRFCPLTYNWYAHFFGFYE